MFQIHYLNKISQQGTALWTEDFSLTDDMEKADGIVLRSANMHDMEYIRNRKRWAFICFLSRRKATLS